MGFEFRGLTPLIQVFDMPSSATFYRDVLGFEILMQSRPGENFDWAWLRKGSASLMLNTAYEADHRPPNPDAARTAAHKDTGLFFDCDDLDLAYAYLRSKGIAARKPETQAYGMRQMYVADPDGYELCFQHPVEKV
jgi:catechol 2,3-dioxygenase-like lactoylglutathione lyase family enzyme